MPRKIVSHFCSLRCRAQTHHEIDANLSTEDVTIYVCAQCRRPSAQRAKGKHKLEQLEPQRLAAAS